MGIDAIYSVFCDAEDCVQWIAEESRRSEAVRAAREAGWVRKRGVGWVCPTQRDDACGAIYNGPVTKWCLLKPNHDGRHDW
jgi:hypothetical protein